MHDFFNQVREGFVVAHLRDTEPKDGHLEAVTLSHGHLGISGARAKLMVMPPLPTDKE